jgi:5'-deoxynucleotidase YfbR-like HD superfamily hydrolase
VPFFSVAEHSVLVLRRLENDCRPSKAERLQALLHDAVEAFIGDLIRPIKRENPAFQDLEESLLKTVFQRFELPTMMFNLVRSADDDQNAEEMRFFFTYSDYYLPPPVCPKCLPPDAARLLFLEEFVRLTQ